MGSKKGGGMIEILINFTIAIILSIGIWNLITKYRAK